VISPRSADGGMRKFADVMDAMCGYELTRDK